MARRGSKGALDPSLVGTWRCESRGTSAEHLEPVCPGQGKEIVLRADGTAEWNWLDEEGRPRFAPDPAAPFPTRWVWQKSGKGVLTILVPVAPIPEYELPDWTQEGVHYQVLVVSPETLTLSDRPFDGEFVEVFRRTEGAREPRLSGPQR